MADLWQKFRSHKGLALLIIILLSFVAFGGWMEYRQWRADRGLKSTMKSIEVPSEWKLISEGYNGNLTCIDICRNYTQTYKVTDNPKQINVDTIANILSTTNLDIGQIQKECIEGDQFNDRYCSAETSSNRYEISSSFTDKIREDSGGEYIKVSFGVYIKAGN